MSVLILNKPKGLTSFQAVLQVKRILNIKKAGHSGTLDPLATGLLIICTGKYTKKISKIQDLQKTYTGEITLGAKTPSFDLETEIDEKFDFSGRLFKISVFLNGSIGSESGFFSLLILIFKVCFVVDLIFFSFNSNNFPKPDAARSVSYTHLTLPTKRIV